MPFETFPSLAKRGLEPLLCEQADSTMLHLTRGPVRGASNVEHNRGGALPLQSRCSEVHSLNRAHGSPDTVRACWL